MFFLLVKKELLDHILSLRFTMSCIICFVVIMSSVFVLTKDYKEAIVDYNTNIFMHREEILSVELPGQLLWRGTKIDKPLNSMKVFFKGIEKNNGATVRVTAFLDPQFEAEYEENPIIPFFPAIDLTFFIGVIMSLLAVAFSYDAISGEKESGTLKLLMSYDIPRHTVILGKWFGGYLALVAPFVLSLLCGTLIVMFFPDVKLEGNWLNLLTIMLVSLLYISAIYSLGLFVSTRTETASSSITVLLLIWIVAILIVPNVMPYIANQISSVESVQVLEGQKRQMEREKNKEMQEKSVKYWTQVAKEQWSKEAGTFFSNLRREGRKAVREEQQKLNDYFRRDLDKQIRLAKNLSRASPLAPFIYSATDISGTGIKERDRFLKVVSRYREKLVNYSYEKQAQLRETDRNTEVFDVTDYPQFRYEYSLLSDRLRETGMNLLLLMLWNLVFFVAAYLSFIRADLN